MNRPEGRLSDALQMVKRGVDIVGQAFSIPKPFQQPAGAVITS
jgi:hypothetical protein